MTCKYCGKTLSDTETICPYCGNYVDATDLQTNSEVQAISNDFLTSPLKHDPKKTRSLSKRRLVLIGVELFVVVLLISGFFVVKNLTEEEDTFIVKNPIQDKLETLESKRDIINIETLDDGSNFSSDDAETNNNAIAEANKVTEKSLLATDKKDIMVIAEAKFKADSVALILRNDSQEIKCITVRFNFLNKQKEIISTRDVYIGNVGPGREFVALGSYDSEASEPFYSYSIDYFVNDEEKEEIYHTDKYKTTAIKNDNNIIATSTGVQGLIVQGETCLVLYDKSVISHVMCTSANTLHDPNLIFNYSLDLEQEVYKFKYTSYKIYLNSVYEVKYVLEEEVIDPIIIYDPEEEEELEIYN